MRRIGVVNNNGRCLIRFTYQGKRYSITSGDYANKNHRTLMQKIAGDIYSDCVLGTFDSSLLKYKKWEQKEEPKQELTLLIELWKMWINETNPPLRTYNNHHKWVEKKIELFNPSLYDSSWFESLEVSPETFNSYLSYLKACFNWAIQKEAVTSNPYSSIKNRKKKATKIEPFTLEEVESIIDAIESDRFNSEHSAFTHSYYAPFFRFLFSTGLRPSEVIGLRFTDLDYATNRICISSSLSIDLEGNGRARKRKETKNGNIWHIPLTETLKGIIGDSKSQNNQNGYDGELIFPGIKGSHIHWGDLSSRLWKPVLNGLNIKYRNPYQIRHTVLSHAAMNPRIGLLGAAKIAGHTNSITVAKHYAQFVDMPELPEMLD